MKSRVIVPLSLSDEQTQRLRHLQKAFSEVCNALMPLVRETRCWNRVGLHHMAYHKLREQFPQMGSQMICNAIYSVSRACRQVYQSPGSAWLVSKSLEKPLPAISFLPDAPVFFDRHTLSMKNGQLSMFTLDGRIRFQISMPADAERRFINDKLREVVLGWRDNQFHLSFAFGEMTDDDVSDVDDFPEYIMVTDQAIAEAEVREALPGVERTFA